MSFNYLDGVPVKIAEKYKPLPKLFTVPQVVSTRLSLPSKYYEQSPQFNYDFQLENTVSEKMEEWARIRQIERESRRERKEKRDQQMLRDIESKNKQLLTAVSYPSAEDLSYDSDNDRDSKSVCYKLGLITEPTVNNHSTTCSNVSFSANSYSFNTILQPTVLDSTSLPGCSSKSPLYNSSNINYSDFENDTSSPFDNVELKTINDLDILAQVLHNTHMQKTDSDTYNLHENITPTKTDPDQNNLENIVREQKSNNDNGGLSTQKTDIPVNMMFEESDKNAFSTTNNSNSFQNFNFNSNMQSQPLQQLGTHSCNPFCENLQQNQQIFINNTLRRDKDGLLANNHYNPLLRNNCNYVHNDSVLYQHTYLIKKNKINPPLPNESSLTSGYTSLNTKESSIFLDSENVAAKSKSRSVPNILRELGDEINNSENRRIRNHSQTLENVAGLYFIYLMM